MHIIEVNSDVSAIIGVAPANVSGTLYLPEIPPDAGVLELLICLHGGGYTRRYWRPDIRDYNFVDHFVARGYAVFALDMLGMGLSTQAEPVSLLSRQKIAAAHDLATRQVVRGLQDGTYASAAGIIATGLGHSMGGMMVITQQAAHASFDRLGVLGWANARMFLGGTDPADLVAAIKSEYIIAPRDTLRGFFYASDVPAEIIAADEAQASVTPATLARDALVPGIVHAAAAAVTIPVFLHFGSIDTSSAPHTEPGYFTASPDVTLALLNGAAHCHNFASQRKESWQRLENWIGSVCVATA